MTVLLFFYSRKEHRENQNISIEDDNLNDGDDNGDNDDNDDDEYYA